MKTPTKKPRFAARKCIRAFASALLPQIRKIDHLNAKQLTVLEKAVNNLSGTNCWWLEFRLIAVLNEVVNDAKNNLPASPHASNPKQK